MTATLMQQQKLDQVNDLVQQKQFSQALTLIKKITQDHPDFAAAWFNCAFLLFQSGEINEAADAINMAKQLEPENFTYAFQEVMMFDSLNRPDKVLPLAQKLAANPPPNQQMNEKLALILEANEDFASALKLYEYMAITQGNQVNWLLKQATAQQNLGNIAQATKLCDQALDTEPNNADGHFLRSHLKKQTLTDNHIDRLRTACDSQLIPPSEKTKLYYALAKELEDCSQWAESFKARHKGSVLFRQSFQYDLQSDIDFMRQIQLEYDADFVRQKSSKNTSERPIFIVGLPRSGTTLLDRIISSHDDVKAAGELKQINRCMLQGLQQLKLNPQLSRTAMVTASKRMDFDRFGQDYLQTSSARTGSKPRFTDKFPQNSYYVGMILKALPNAKIIIMQRHPVAICYAVYKQLFSQDSYPFSYDLEEMAAYYNQHNQLLNHWQQIGGDSVKTVYYEDLVKDLTHQAKDILAFLNLTWQPQCLDFHKNRQPTATASASQVRQKLYTGSVDLWRHYEQQLQPLIKMLDVNTGRTNP
ncbi:tetratricopeptide repeat-containing sulfotransferase family protein [Marinicella litoralis]|uniref:Tetratricopeptide repeat protein n=1 Tax=Marinicella litoralis TaxID=644220 RepID=A0A4R6XTG9_9GAMM|nr:sulfotransferase [Marinicella litoralis]TDR23252.1 tetratricopeptide repeat protein [Marinicella litoralis]